MIGSTVGPLRPPWCRAAKLLAWLLTVSSLGGCGAWQAAGETARQQPPMSGERWRQARRALEALRREYGRERPYTMNLTLTLTHPQTGRRLRARGAVAVSPRDEALRMILLGPGGTTALDLWVCGDQFRFVLPAVGLRRRGRLGDPAQAAERLPVGFLRWWLLHPLAGRLLYASASGDRWRFVLRDGTEVVDVSVEPDRSLDAVRRSRTDRQRVRAAGPGCAPVRYRQGATGLDIAVVCESIQAGREPSPRAFADPDAPARGCASPPGARP